MKKIIAIVLAVLLAIPALSVMAFADASTEKVGYSADRVATVDLTDVPNILDYFYLESSVFKITGASGMEYMSYLYGKGLNFKNMTLYLANDIDMTGSKYTPVQDFQGTFDGQGHIIDNLVIGVAATPAGGGLFISMRGATIKNVIIGENCSQTCVSVDQTGFIASNMNGNDTVIDNVYVAASVSGKKFTGGFVGASNGGIISNSTFAGTVTADHSDAAVGGMAGFAGKVANNPASDGAKFMNCRNVGAVESKGLNNDQAVAGGIAGRTWDDGVYFDGCINNGTVISQNSYAGSIFGKSNDRQITLSNCKNYGTLTSKGATVYTFVGGADNADFTDCVEASGTTDATYVALTITPNYPATDPYVPRDPETGGNSGGNIFGDDDEEEEEDTTTKPSKSKETTAAADTTTTAPDTTSEETSGCGATIGTAIGVLACATLAVAIGRKKED